MTRTKKNVVLRHRYSHAVDKSTGVRSDALRLVSYVAPETNNRLKILTIYRPFSGPAPETNDSTPVNS